MQLTVCNCGIARIAVRPDCRISMSLSHRPISPGGLCLICSTIVQSGGFIVPARSPSGCTSQPGSRDAMCVYSWQGQTGSPWLRFKSLRHRSALAESQSCTEWFGHFKARRYDPGKLDLIQLATVKEFAMSTLVAVNGHTIAKPAAPVRW